MNIQKYVAALTQNVAALKLISDENEYVAEFHRVLKQEIQEGHLFHVIENTIATLSWQNKSGCTLAAIETLFDRLSHDHELALVPDLAKRIKSVFLKQFAAYHELPEGVETEDTVHLLSSYLQKDPKQIFESSVCGPFLKALSLEAQLELALTFAEKGDDYASAIRLFLLDKIKLAPVAVRMQLAMMIASQGAASAKHLLHELHNLDLNQAPLASKVELAGVMIQNGAQALVDDLDKLQSSEPKREYRAFLREVVKKCYVEPGGLKIDLDQFQTAQEKEADAPQIFDLGKLATSALDRLSALVGTRPPPPPPRELSSAEKLRQAKELASLGGFAAFYMVNRLHVVNDLELAAILARQGEHVLRALIDRVNELDLPRYQFENRFALLEVIFDQYLPKRGVKKHTLQLIDAAILPDDTLENRLRCYQKITKGKWGHWLVYAYEEILRALLKTLPATGCSVETLDEVLRKNEDDANCIIEFFNCFQCPAPKLAIFELVSTILTLGERPRRCLAVHLNHFFFNEVPVLMRLEKVNTLLRLSPNTAFSIAGHLACLDLADVEVTARLPFITSLVQCGESEARLVAEKSESLKLEEVGLPDRISLAFLVARQGNRSAGALLNHIRFFHLENAPLNKLFELATLVVEQGVGHVLIAHPEYLRIGEYSAEQRRALGKQIVVKTDLRHLKILKRGTAAENFKTKAENSWLSSFPWQDQMEFAQLIIQKGDVGAAGLALNLEYWDFRDAPLHAVMSLAAAIIQQHQLRNEPEVERANRLNPHNPPLQFAHEFLNLFSNRANTTELIWLLKRFAKQSSNLVGIALTKLTSPPLDLATCRQVILEFLIDAPTDLKAIFDHAAMAEVKPLLNLLTMKTDEVQEVVNQTDELPEDAKKAIEEAKHFLASNGRFAMLVPFVGKVGEIASPMVQFNMMQWLAYTAGQFSLMEQARLQAIGETGIMETIFSHQSLPNRFTFVRELVHSPRPFTPRESRQEHGKLASLLLLRLKSLGVAEGQLQQIHAKIDGRSPFKETIKFTPLVELLNAFILLPSLSEKEINGFLDRLLKILSLKTIDEVSLNIDCLMNILTLLGREKFFEALGRDNLESFFLEEFKTQVDLGDIPNFTEKFKASFGSSRNPNAVFTYLRCIEMLPLDERERTKAAFIRYMQAVLNGNWPQARYATVNASHIPEEIKKLWLEKEEEIVVGNYRIFITDNFIDFLLLGTEPKGSCQSIHGIPKLNKCLCSYMWDWRDLPVVATDKQGKIVARAILRLGEDVVQSEGEAVQYQQLPLREHLYSNVKDEKLAQGMTKLALNKAKKMGAPLLEKDKSLKRHGAVYRGTYSFPGTDYPFGYGDAFGGPFNALEGFTLENCYIVEQV